MAGIHPYIALVVLIAAIIHFVWAWSRYIRYYLKQRTVKRSVSDQIRSGKKEALLAVRPFLILSVYLAVLYVYSIFLDQ